MSKKRKKVESVFQSFYFTFLRFEIANGHFRCKTIAHNYVMLYIQHNIKTVHFWSKYNGLAIVRKTTKLIEGGHRGLHGVRHYFYTGFFYVFYVFQNPKSRDFLRFLPCFVR